MFPFNNREHGNPHVWGPKFSKNPVSKEKRSPVSLTFTLQAEATVSSDVISNSLGPNVVGMARAARRSEDIEGSVTCLGPRIESPPSVAAPTVSSASVISSSSASWRRRAMVSVPVWVVT
jgi:hypothetical protein